MAKVEGMSWHASISRWERCLDGEAGMMDSRRAAISTSNSKVYELEGMLCRAVEPTAFWRECRDVDEVLVPRVSGGKRVMSTSLG